MAGVQGVAGVALVYEHITKGGEGGFIYKEGGGGPWGN